MVFHALLRRSFNSQPPEGGCQRPNGCHGVCGRFQLTAARRRLRRQQVYLRPTRLVSTHSRPKAAAISMLCPLAQIACFNSQPPEGGCIQSKMQSVVLLSFQLTAARRRLRGVAEGFGRDVTVSTHSRPKAAAFYRLASLIAICVSTHSRPKAAAGCYCKSAGGVHVSTHSRPKAAAGAG